LSVHLFFFLLFLSSWLLVFGAVLVNTGGVLCSDDDDDDVGALCTSQQCLYCTGFFFPLGKKCEEMRRRDFKKFGSNRPFFFLLF